MTPAEKEARRKQALRALHAEARKRGLSHDDLHEAAAAAGFSSLSEMSAAELKRWTNRTLRRRHPGLGSAAARRQAGLAGRKQGDEQPQTVELVSAATLNLLGDYRQKLGWTAETFERFVERQLGRKKILTTAEANKVLWGMKRMARGR